MTAAIGDFILTRRARATRTVVSLVFCGADHSDGKWMTLCEDHAGCVHHPTRELAMGWLSHPDEWCPTCQEAKRPTADS